MLEIITCSHQKQTAGCWSLCQPPVGIGELENCRNVPDDYRPIGSYMLPVYFKSKGLKTPTQDDLGLLPTPSELHIFPTVRPLASALETGLCCQLCCSICVTSAEALSLSRPQHPSLQHVHKRYFRRLL